MSTSLRDDGAVTDLDAAWAPGELRDAELRARLAAGAPRGTSARRRPDAPVAVGRGAVTVAQRPFREAVVAAAKKLAAIDTFVAACYLTNNDNGCTEPGE